MIQVFNKLKSFYITFLFLLFFFNFFINYIFADNLEKNIFSDTLIVSNYPEEIIKPGIIFSEIINKKPLRILFYHKNKAKNNLFINLIVTNTTSRIIKIKVIKALFGPCEDGIFAGHAATKKFVTDLVQGKYQEIVLLPKQKINLFSYLIKSDQISTGLIRILPQKKGEIKVTLLAVEDKLFNLSYFEESKDIFNYGLFYKSTKKISLNFSNKTPIEEISIGDKPFLKDHDHNITLYGNYGLFYLIDVILNNKDNWYKKVDLYFSPTAGGVRGLLIINNQIIETGYFDIKDNLHPKKIFALVLNPKSRKKIHIITIPEAGSFYPVKLVFQTK
ncbi:MAG: hypothetical protein WC860_09015 [Candidatus Margulisiibacteriota bacterium]|jgi:hypothetical protein